MRTNECLKDTYKVLSGKEITDKTIDTTCEVIHEINKVLPAIGRIYDTNETIDFTAIYAEYLAGTTNNGKIRPFTSSDTLLSADSIKKIIDGNYKMFSFNAQLDDDVMKAYMQINYETQVDNVQFYYTFKGKVTIQATSDVWADIEIQMQIKNTNGTYDNNPAFGYFRMSRVDVITSN